MILNNDDMKNSEHILKIIILSYAINVGNVDQGAPTDLILFK